MPGNGAPLIPFSLMSRRRMGTVIGAVNATRTARARENASRKRFVALPLAGR